MPVIKAGRHNIEFGRKTLIMGILNITPDSFSDGGNYFEPADAISQAVKLIESGVDLIDIGGESSRPGSSRVHSSEEIKRIIPVVEYLTSQFPQMPLSIDTWKHDVAEASLAAGASIINDIYGLLADRKLAEVCRKHEAGVVLMHNAVIYRLDHPEASVFSNAFRLDAETASDLSHLPLIQSMINQLKMSLSVAHMAGLSQNQLIIDPGVGFGLATDESLSLIRNLAELKCFSLPILLAPSRKRFIGDVLDVPVGSRQAGTAASVSAGICNGADLVRIHDIEFIKPVIVMTDAIQRKPDETGRIIGHNSCVRDTMVRTDRNMQLNEQSDIHSGGSIIMRGMKFRGNVGVLAEEKTLGQEFTIDIVLELLNDEAFTSDKLSDTISYAEIFEKVGLIVGTARFDLIEKLAGYIADELLAEYPHILAATDVTVGKPQAPIAGSFDTMAVRIRKTNPLW